MGGLLDLDAVVLTRGVHARRTDEVSLLEAVAWWAGEPHSDRPACVSPVVAAFVRAWADALDDRTRQQLKGWVPKLVATGNGLGDQTRALLLADWLARVCAPSFLRAAGLQREASLLEGSAEIGGWAPAVAVRPAVADAYQAAKTHLDAAWIGRTSGPDAPQAAQEATRRAAAAAAAGALQVALGTSRSDLEVNERGWPTGNIVSLEVLLAAALQTAVGGDPAGTLAARLERVRVAALGGMRDAVVVVVDAAALAGALRAPPDAAAQTLQPTVKHLQTTAFDLLEGLCVAGKVTVNG
jgi:hypothetical protein